MKNCTTLPSAVLFIKFVASSNLSSLKSVLKALTEAAPFVISFIPISKSLLSFAFPSANKIKSIFVVWSAILWRIWANFDLASASLSLALSTSLLRVKII